MGGSNPETSKILCERFACFGRYLRPFLLGSDFPFHLNDHLGQEFFTFFLTVGIDVAGVLFTVWPDGGVTPLPEFFIDLGDTAGTCFAPLALVGLEGVGGWLSGCYLSHCLRIRLSDALVDFCCRRPAHLIGDVGVDVQRGAAGDVPDDGGEGLDVHAMLQ